MHAVSERELQFGLEDEEVVDLAVSIANDMKSKGHFKEFLVQVEDVPYWCDEGGSGGNYTILKVFIQSNVLQVLLDTPNTSDNIVVEQASYSEEGRQQLIEHGTVLADLLKAAMPDVNVETDYPQPPSPEPEPKPESEPEK